MERLLPIGTVVLLKESKKRLMIMGFCQKKVENAEEEKIWDYCACLYPEGYISPNSMFLFNHEQIEKIYALGYQDEEQFQFSNELQNAIENYNKKGEK